ncbi:MAG TPA: T9SS type A sorting domain-containing protein [Luteibaculaceae bacterium]|nr:T9SS type A sorting domain-containing protein [Luteibaculaceae bacterium]
MAATLIFHQHSPRAQVVKSFVTDSHTSIEHVFRSEEGLLLCAGREFSEPYSEEFRPYLVVYDFAQNEVVRNLMDFDPSLYGFISDVKKHGDHYYALLNLYVPFRTHPEYSFGIIKLNSQFERETVYWYPIGDFPNYWADKMAVMSPNNFRIVGSQRENFGTSYEYRVLNCDTSKLISSGRWSFSVIDWYYFNSDAYAQDTTFTQVILNGNFFGDDFCRWNAEGNIYYGRSLPDHLEARVDLNSDGTVRSSTPAWSNMRFKGITQISDSVLVSSSLYAEIYTAYPSLDDSIRSDFGVYFFTPDIDSIRYVNLTRKYNYRFDGPGNIDVLPNKHICVGATLNNIALDMQHGQGVPFMRWYDETPVAPVLVAKMSLTGETLWEQIILPQDGDELRLINDVIAMPDGGCLLVGNRYKYPETLLHDPLFIYVDSLGTLGGLQSAKEKLDFNLYPNPTQNELYIQVPLHSSGQFRVFDSQGRIVMYGPWNSTQVGLFDVGVSALPPGIYTFSLLTAEGKQNSKRFVKE